MLTSRLMSMWHIGLTARRSQTKVDARIVVNRLWESNIILREHKIGLHFCDPIDKTFSRRNNHALSMTCGLKNTYLSLNKLYLFLFKTEGSLVRVSLIRLCHLFKPTELWLHHQMFYACVCLQFPAMPKSWIICVSVCLQFPARSCQDQCGSIG